MIRELKLAPTSSWWRLGHSVGASFSSRPIVVVIPAFNPVADSALLAEFENRIDEAVNDRVLALLAALEAATIDGVIEAVPAYRTLLVYYDPLRIDYEHIRRKLEKLAESESTSRPKGRRWRVPVWYGGPAAKDLKAVARRHGLSVDEVIDIHSSTVYRVYLVGFAPGWTFLGGLDARLHTPRLDSPRAEVPDGAISIAGQQGLICGPAMPSGWNLIGQTPERTWAPEREEPFFIEPGDEVEIRRIDGKEFKKLAKRVAGGERVSQEMDRGEGAAPTSSPRPHKNLVGAAQAMKAKRFSPAGERSEPEGRPRVPRRDPFGTRASPGSVGAALWPRPESRS